MHQPARAALHRQPALSETHMENWYLPMRIDHNGTVAGVILEAAFCTKQLNCFSCLRLAHGAQDVCRQWFCFYFDTWAPASYTHLLGHTVPSRLFGNRRANSALGYTPAFFAGVSSRFDLPPPQMFPTCTEIHTCCKWAQNKCCIALLRCWSCHLANLGIHFRNLISILSLQFPFLCKTLTVDRCSGQAE